MIFVRDIQRAVARHYGIPVEKLVQRDNRREFARPRQIAVTLARRFTRHSRPRIGELFGGLNNSTIIHAERAVEKLRKNDHATLKSIRLLTVELLRGER